MGSMHQQSLRETIKDIVETHLLKNNGIAMGQCLSAVGWVGGTLPELFEKDGMVELSMADVAGGGFAVGSALAGKRPIYIIRYQGFNWFNAPIIINYAAKSKELWKQPCPIFVRSIAMEGGIGPVAGSSHHAIYYRMPGIKIFSPMTPYEYSTIYDEFMKNDDVYYISEHRKSFDNKINFKNIIKNDVDITIFAISITRFSAIEALDELSKLGYKINLIHLWRLKPLHISSQAINSLKNSKYGGLVLDDDYVDGIAKSIAYDLMSMTNNKVNVLGLKDKSAGFDKKVDNLPPSCNEIKDKVIKIIESNKG